MANVKILTICSRNRWRSPTAEKLINELSGFQARSAGTEPSARVRVNEKLISWADIILVMERRHLRRLQGRFPELISGKTVHCLNIPDQYRYMAPELIDILNDHLDELLKQP